MKSNPTTPSNPSAFEFQTEAQLLDVQELTAAQNMNVSLERRNAEAMQASALGRDELERRLNKPIRLAEQKLAELKAQVKGSAHHLKMIKEALQKMAEEALRQPGSAYDLMVKAIEALSFRKTEASLLFSFTGIVVEGYLATPVEQLSSKTLTEVFGREYIELGIRTPAMTVLADANIDQISAMRDFGGKRLTTVETICQRVVCTPELLTLLKAWVDEDLDVKEAEKALNALRAQRDEALSRFDDSTHQLKAYVVSSTDNGKRMLEMVGKLASAAMQAAPALCETASDASGAPEQAS
jgi:hypothetical protein